MTSLGSRNLAILVTFLDTGLRLAEPCHLRFDHTHLEEGYAKVMGKGSKERVMPISAQARKVIWRYVFHFRPEFQTEFDNNLFLTLEGRSLKPNSVRLLLKRWGRRVGVPRLHAHLCRHT